jgi:hypothetical protein
MLISHFAGVVNGIACYLHGIVKRLGYARECSNRSGDDFCCHLRCKSGFGVGNDEMTSHECAKIVVGCCDADFIMT